MDAAGIGKAGIHDTDTVEQTMTISYQSHAKLDALLIAVSDLGAMVAEAADDMPVVRQRVSIFGNLDRYVSMIDQGRSGDDAIVALKGANLLTTVNKGVGDAEQEPDDRRLAEQAFRVAQLAIDAAKSLRDDAGIVL